MKQQPAARAWRGLAKRVSEVLCTTWDPLAVVDEPHARAEYEPYVPEVTRYLVLDVNAEELAALLAAIRWDRIGLAGHDDATDRQAARLLKDLKWQGAACAGL